MNSKISHFWLWSWIMTFFGNRLEYFLSDWCPNRPFAPSCWEEHDMHSFAKSNENVMFMLWINKAPINHPLLIAKNIFISKKYALKYCKDNIYCLHLHKTFLILIDLHFTFYLGIINEAQTKQIAIPKKKARRKHRQELTKPRRKLRNLPKWIILAILLKPQSEFHFLNSKGKCLLTSWDTRSQT